MNALLDQFFGTGRLGFGADGVSFDWARPVPAWGWLLVAAAVIIIAVAVYRGVDARLRTKVWLASLRAAMLALIAVLASGPQLTRQDTTTEPDWLVVLADRSASLQIADAPDRQTREDQLRAALAAIDQPLTQAGESREVLRLGFDRSVFELPEPTADATLPDPAGRETRLAAALDETLRRLAGRPLAGIVLLSDGRSADNPDEQLLARLASEQIPVFTVPLGGEAGSIDRAVERVEAPRVVFAGDTVPVRAWARTTGVEPDDTGSAKPVRLELVDTATDRVLAEATALPGEAAVLLAQPDDLGQRDWAVRIAGGGDDLIASNDAQAVAIEIVDRPIRVLYIDGYPRWENRYLKSLLLRESSIRSSSVLLAADRQYQQEGDEPIDRLPITREEWAEFDVIIIGDVRSDLFGIEQLQGLRAHISGAGAGLLWMAGPAAIPQSWRATDLADLLPLRSTSSESTERLWGEPVTLRPTPAAELISLLRAGLPGDGPPAVADPALGWTLLRWAQRIDPASIKPAAEVLALATPVGGGDAAPLVLSMRYGTGRAAYVATDETWRWRYGRGETLSEQFWIPMLRYLARNRLARAGRPAILSVSPDPVLRGSTARVELDLIDQALLDAAPDEIRVAVTREGEPQSELVLRSEVAESAATPGEPPAGLYTASWAPNTIGRYTLDVSEPILAGFDLAASADVIDPDDEMRFPQPDHELLVRLASASGGAVLRSGELDRLPGLIPNRSIVVPSPPETESLWDKPWALVTFLVLLSLELVTRRLARLP